VLKLKHLLHPLGTAVALKALLASHWTVRRSASRGARRFRNDPRYNLQCVTDGFASRIADGGDDTALLSRICQAYIAAAEQDPVSGHEYNATGWWQDVRRSSLTPVRRALAARDTDALRAMYQNFFRDPCSAGLIGLPLAKVYFGGTIHDVYRHSFLSDALHRIDYWKAQTGNRFELRELAGPGIGNPFGVLMDGTLVCKGAEYQHYCAQRIQELVPSPGASIVEIGGGYGGMAYYLLRGKPQFTYIDFDVPESLALISYYLLKSFPNLKFLLYGEEDLTQGAIARSNVILMPPFELSKVPTNSVDVTFSSHTMSDLSRSAQIAYLNEIERMTRKSFLNISESEGSALLDELIATQSTSLRVAEKRTLEWNNHKILHAKELECHYRIGSKEQH
jgi:putative sugar O-methyltransferase